LRWRGHSWTLIHNLTGAIREVATGDPDCLHSIKRIAIRRGYRLENCLRQPFQDNTATVRSFFLTLLRRNEVTKAQLHNAIENNRAENSDPTDQKMVDAVVCHIRRKLKNDRVDIKTIWGVGYSIAPDQRSHLINILADHLSGAKNGFPQSLTKT
jgi:Transcriptional regulatory protein, C terminal